MSLKTYSILVSRTRPVLNTINEEYTNAVLGLTGEAGEVTEHIKKALFQGHELSAATVCLELGDTLWYMDWLRSLFGLTWEEILQSNIAKLRARYPELVFSAERSLDRGGGS